MGSYSDRPTYHQTQVSRSILTPARQAAQFTYPERRKAALMVGYTCILRRFICPQTVKLLPIQVLTGPGVEQLRCSNQRTKRYRKSAEAELNKR